METAIESTGVVVPSLVRELLRLTSEKRTGVLEVRAESLVTIVYFSSGTPVFAEEGTLGETLGRVLVRQGKLTQDQYIAVLKRMTKRVMDSEQLRFGEVAVALGFIDAGAISDGLREQAHAKVSRCLQWRESETTFREDADAVADVAHFPCPIASVLWQGVRRFFDPERCQEVWGLSTATYPTLIADRAAIADMLSLSADERAFVNLLDGIRSTETLVQSSPLDVVHASQLLTALLLLGSATLKDEPSELPSRRVQVPLPPPRYSDVPAPAPPGRRAGSSDHRGARVSTQHRARLAAETAFQEGKRQLFAGELAAALSQFQESVHHLPDAAEYAVYLEWTRFSLVEHAGERLLRRRELRGIAIRALKQDITLAMAHYVLAELAILDHNEQGEQSALKLALRFDARHPLIQRLVQARAGRH